MLKSRAVVVFGLNELSGKTINSQGPAVGAWNSSDAESLMRYTVNKGYTIHGWELGKKSMHKFERYIWKQFDLALNNGLSVLNIRVKVKKSSDMHNSKNVSVIQSR